MARSIVVSFQKLGGVFEVRVYPPEYSIASLLAACQDRSTKGAEEENKSRSRTGTGIHVRKLNKLLDKIDFRVIRRRRAVYMRIYHEANVMYYHRGKGISFTDMLVLLAHHKLIDDREALGCVCPCRRRWDDRLTLHRLKELEVREETLKLVAGLVGLDKVRSQLRMISLRRAFLRTRAAVPTRGTFVPFPC